MQFARYYLMPVSKYILFIFILLINYPVRSQLLKAQSSAPIIVIALPSSDCINCRALAIETVRKLTNLRLADSMVLLTNDDAGAFYIDQSRVALGNLPLVMDKGACMQFAPQGRSTINYVSDNETVSLELKYGVDSFTNLISVSKGVVFRPPLLQDTVILKYNVFNDWGNVLLKANNKLFLFSTPLNMGCFLEGSTADTSELLPSYISATQYDSFYQHFNCSAYANVDQQEIREFSAHTNIPFSKIYSATTFKKSSYLLYYFFTAKRDTVTEDSISVRYKYNIGILQSIFSNLRSPANLSDYQFVLKIPDTIRFAGKFLQMRTFSGFGVSDNFFYLPLSGLIGQGGDDSSFYIGKFSRKSGTAETPADLLHYTAGKFTEDCFFSSTDSNPILVNHVSQKIDFGEGNNVIEFDRILMPDGFQDTIQDILDISAENIDKVKVVASTKNGAIIAGIFVNKKAIKNIARLCERKNAVYCKIQEDARVVIVHKDNKKLVTKLYSPLWSDQ